MEAPRTNQEPVFDGSGPGNDASPADAFAVAVSALMEERGLSVRSLAKRAGVSPGHLSRVARAADGKRPSPALVLRVSKALELRDDFFLEARRATIHRVVDIDPAFANRVYTDAAETRSEIRAPPERTD